METICKGCLKEGCHNDKTAGQQRGHVCRCQSKPVPMKIEAGLDQAAAAANTLPGAAGCGAQVDKGKNDLKSKIIRIIKDLPPNCGLHEQ